MTLDDESLLSAYLDGELGPEQQQAVESALIADPHLAEEMRILAGLRDLVAGLPRAASADVTSRVMRRVRRRAALTRAFRAGGVPWGPVRAAGIVGLAATLLVGMGIPWLLHYRGGPRQDPAGISRQAARTIASIADRPAQSLVSVTRWPSFASHRPEEVAAGPVGRGGQGPGQPDPTAGEASTSSELMHVREYLDNPQLRRIFLVSDLEDGSARKQVASVVEQTTRFNFYKITISQGIVIDPRHPDQAIVFALVVGPRELESLRERLRSVLSERLEESPVNPEVVTQLADIGHVQACPPSPMADMSIPRDDWALRIGNAAGAEAPPPDAKAADRPTPEQEYSSPAAELAARAKASGAPAGSAHPPGANGVGRRPADRPGPAEKPEETFVVLVWVTRARPG